MKKISAIIFFSLITLGCLLAPSKISAADITGTGACTVPGDRCVGYPGDTSRVWACVSTTTGQPITTGTGRCAMESGFGGFTGIIGAPQSAAEAYWRTKPGVASNMGQMDIIIAATGDAASTQNYGGTTAVLGYMTAMYDKRPASSAEYIADLKENFGIQRTYAQGYSFGALSPILQIWKLTRNIALAGFVIIFVVIGMMLILRTKIDPRTVITIQQALPRIVICLIMVIFSYAIIGALLDGVTLLTRIGASILQQQGYLAIPNGTNQPLDGQQLLNRLMTSNVFALYNQLFNVDELIGGFANLNWASNSVTQILQLDRFAFHGGLTRTVLWIAMFIAVIRTFFMLLQSYLSITLAIIVSPFQFLFYALPDQSGKFGDWFRNILAHMLVFPVVFFMLAFAAIFYAQPGNTVWYGNPDQAMLENIWSIGPGPQGGTQAPAFSNQVAYWAPPGFGDWSGIVGPLLTLAILLTTPKAINITRELVHPKYRPSAAEGEVATGIQKAAARIPMLGSFTRA